MRDVTASPLLRLPLWVKIRILASTEATVRLCTQLALAGASLIAIHGRQRGRVEQRRDGAADLSVIRAVKAALHQLPVHVLTNGNVRTAEDVLYNLRYTRADGAMVAEAISKQPALFLGCLPPSSSECPYPPSPLQLVRLYVSYVRECGCDVSWSAEELWLRVTGHFHRMAGAELRRLQVEGSIERPCNLDAFDCVLQQAEERAEEEARGEWRADPALDEEAELSRERRQRMMEVIRARVRQRERMGEGDLGEEAAASSCTSLLNSKQRYRKRRREEKAAQQKEQAAAIIAKRDDV